MTDRVKSAWVTGHFDPRVTGGGGGGVKKKTLVISQFILKCFFETLYDEVDWKNSFLGDIFLLN